MRHRDLAGLTAEQVRLLLTVRARALRDGTPAVNLLLQSGAPREDQAVVADRLCPGAGDGYRR
ncbi:hypothetical protein [Actinoplanes sp. URMC 104]|uniref:hypothetical protein n=1 Tax=Actinoplanes sp. URMC 104 TaxID=3423409 RepID=UPI003F1936C3